MAYNPQDFYFKKAKKEGFLARSAYKLDEIQSRFKIIRPNMKVLDLGCAPGAWSQIIMKVLGGTGFLRGIDLKPVTLKFKNAEFMVGDIYQTPETEFKEAPYDLIVSDMAPNTSGIPFRDQALSEELCLKVLDICDRLLKPKGDVVMKFFMSPAFKDLENKVKARFERVQVVRPDSTRKISKEIFIVGFKKK